MSEYFKTLSSHLAPYRKQLIAALILLSLAAAWWGLQAYKQYRLQNDWHRITDAVANVQSYSASINTKTVLEDRELNIFGTYHIDHNRHHYRSLSTTTITIPGEEREGGSFSFNLENIVLDDKIYTWLSTDSQALSSTIAWNKAWREFDKGRVPTELREIAVEGPVTDPLNVFVGGGKLLKPLTRTGTDNPAELGFVVELTGENTGSLASEIGDGHIIVFADKVSGLPTRLVFENLPYRSEITIFNINNPPDILAPKI